MQEADVAARKDRLFAAAAAAAALLNVSKMCMCAPRATSAVTVLFLLLAQNVR